MKALYLSDVEKIGVREVPSPKPHAGEVLIRMKSAAVCRTDAKMWKMGHRDLVLPRIPGHEICAVREDDGRRYVVWPGNACGKCHFCLNGCENLCGEMKITGFHHDGGLAEYATVPEASLMSAPDHLSDDVACLAEPVACTLNALEMAAVRNGQKVLIYGGGPVGLMTALAVQSRGAGALVCEVNPKKVKRSQAFQEKTGINVTRRPAEDRYHVVVNASSSPKTFTRGIQKIVKGGCFCIFSGFTNVTNSSAKEMAGALNEAHYRQITITGAYGCTREQMRSALNLISDCQEDFSFLIERKISLENVPAIMPKIWAGEVFRYVVQFN